METPIADLDKQIRDSILEFNDKVGYTNFRAQKTSDPFVVLVLCDDDVWKNVGVVYYYQDFPRTWAEWEHDNDGWGHTFESLQQAWDNHCESVGTAALMDRHSA